MTAYVEYICHRDHQFEFFWNRAAVGTKLIYQHGLNFYRRFSSVLFSRCRYFVAKTIPDFRSYFQLTISWAATFPLPKCKCRHQCFSWCRQAIFLRDIATWFLFVCICLGCCWVMGGLNKLKRAPPFTNILNDSLAAAQRVCSAIEPITSHYSERNDGYSEVALAQVWEYVLCRQYIGL